MWKRECLQMLLRTVSPASRVEILPDGSSGLVTASCCSTQTPQNVPEIILLLRLGRAPAAFRHGVNDKLQRMSR